MDTYLFVGIIITSSFVVIWQIVLFVALCIYRHRAKDYNRFIHHAYTRYEKETPAIVGRIQYSYIEIYNKYRKRCMFLSLFFRPLPILGSPIKRDYDLFNTRNLDIETSNKRRRDTRKRR